MLGKKKVKVTENRIENTDFAYAATSRPGHMPRQLPARLSGIRSIVCSDPGKNSTGLGIGMYVCGNVHA